MREILFRGKNERGKWEYGSLIKTGYFCCILEDDDGTDFDYPYLDELTGCIDGYAIPVDAETVGQFTGMTDKNGKKIFEGDIIKSDNGIQSAVSVVCCGEFSPLMFYDLLENFVMPRPKEKLVGLFLKSITNGEEMFLSNCSKLLEVIGNIYDNPELLEVE